MTELHVGAGFALKTLAKAAAVAKGGDTVFVHAGVYAAGFKPPAGTTWVGAEGEERPVIDGGWKGGNLSPADANGYGVMVSAAGVTLRGFEVRNIAGRGVVIGPGGDGLVLEDFEIHHTFSGGLACNGSGKAIADIAIRRGHVHDISLSGRWRETPVSGCFLFKDANNLLVEDVLIERGHGEGIAAGFRSTGVVFRRVTVRDTTHLAMYVANCATDVLVEDCVVYQTGLAEFRQGDGDVGAGYVVGDEVAEGKDANRPHSENVTLRRCVAVNCSGALQVRNGTKVKNGLLDGYDTRIQNLTVERCTFVGGSHAAGVGAGENDQGAKVRGVVRDCVMAFDVLQPGGVQAKVTAPGVRLEGNFWTAGVPAGLPASNQALRSAALVAPLATVADGFSIDNYRPVAGGPLDGAGIGALEPLPVEPPPVVDPPPDPEPEPEPVDWDALFERAAAVGVQLATIGAALADAREQVAVASLAQDAAAGELAALLAALDEAKAAND